MSILQIFLLIALIPLGAYLRAQTYRAAYGNSSVWRDLRSFVRSVRKWRARRRKERELKKKYRHLNDRRQIR